MKFIFFMFSMLCSYSYSQVGIGTATPNASAMLDINSTTGGVLVPRMTLAQKAAIPAPANGLLVYQTDGVAGFWYYNGIAWVTFTSSGWSLTGDTGTNPATNYIGTADNQDFIIATNNAERVRIQADGDIGINQNNPTAKIQVNGIAPVFRMQDGKEGLNNVLSSDANGNASWVSSSILSASDLDWIFLSGNTFADPVYHVGPVVIGKTGTTTHVLDVDNGLNTGTTVGVGDVELITDGNNETIFSHRFCPADDNTSDFGKLYGLPLDIQRWNTIYAVNGTIQTSDKNKKTAINPLSYGIKEIMKLKPVSYNWKEEKSNNLIIPEEKKQLKLGFIAQEVEKIIPEVVYTSGYFQKSEKDPGYEKVNFNRIGINYEELIPVLVKAKQEQDLEIISLKTEAESLAKRAQELLKANEKQ